MREKGWLLQTALGMGCFGRKSDVVAPEPPGINTWAAPATSDAKPPSSPQPIAISAQSANAGNDTPPGNDTPETASPTSSAGEPAPAAEWQVAECGSPANAVKGGLAPLQRPLGQPLRPLGAPLGSTSSLPPLAGRPLAGAPLPKLAVGTAGGGASSALGPPPRMPLKDVNSSGSNGVTLSTGGLRPLSGGAGGGGPLPPPPLPLPRSHTVPLGALPPPGQPASGAQPSGRVVVVALPPPSSLPLAAPSSVPQQPLQAPPKTLLPPPSSLPAAAAAVPPAPPTPDADADAVAAPPPPPPAPAKSALAKGVLEGGAKPRRRISLSDEPATRIYYSPGQEKPVDNYRANLDELGSLRHARTREGKSECSFAELVSELDAKEGGEGLSCLVPRKVDPPPGSWMASRGMTWGQMQPSGGAGGVSATAAASCSSGYSCTGGAGYSSQPATAAAAS